MEKINKRFAQFADTSGTVQFFKNPIKFAKTQLGFEFWQRFSKALIIVVAVMPAGGILISVGRLFSPGFINTIGGDLPTDPAHGIFIFGGIIESLGWFFIVNLGPLFAIAIAGNWSKDKAGGAFAGFIGYALFHTTSVVIAKAMYGELIGTMLDVDIFSDKTIGIVTLNGSQVFSGILIGFVAGNVYNKYHTFDRLPKSLQFFGGARFVPFAMVWYSQIWAFLFAAAWPWMSQGISAVGTWLTTSGGTFYAPAIYGAGERVLLPFGLHHMLTIPMNYSALGGEYLALSNLPSLAKDIAPVYGQDPLWLKWMGDVAYLENTHGIKNAANLSAEDLWTKVQATPELMSELSQTVKDYAEANIATTQETLVKTFANTVPARFKVGQVVASTALLPAMAIGMYMAIPKENRSSVYSIYVSAAVTVSVAGITEPIEFMFAFISPLMYLVYAMGTGIMWGVADALAYASIDLRVHAFGAIEIIARMPQMLATSLWKDFLYFVTYSGLWGVIGYFGFYYLTKYMQPLIPGIAAENETAAINAAGAAKAKGVTKSKASTDVNVATIVKALGGKTNITNVDNCFTRLRVAVKDTSKVKKDLFVSTGATGTIIRGKGVQVVYGGQVESIRHKVDAYLGK